MAFRSVVRAATLVVGGVLGLAACSSYPDAPRYAIYADAAPAPTAATYAAAAAPIPSGEGVRGPTNPANEAPLPSAAPVASIEGGALDAPASGASYTASSYSPPAYATTPAAGPASEGFASPPPPASGAPMVAGSVYVIQPGDTISGVGRRFRTPVQALIDLNALGPRADVAPGRSLRLPAGAVDGGADPYATGPSPTAGLGGVAPTASYDAYASAAPVAAPAYIPPPPPPPTEAEMRAPPPAVSAASARLDWPVRGDILRRFGPAGTGERNNGVNIGAPAGAEVRASAAGEVAYVGDDLAGQGLTVLVKHADGWRTVYGHLGSSTVRDGDTVRAGQSIGTVGNTAGDGRPSIHFETWRMQGDEPLPEDPLTVLPR